MTIRGILGTPSAGCAARDELSKQRYQRGSKPLSHRGETREREKRGDGEEPGNAVVNLSMLRETWSYYGIVHN